VYGIATVTPLEPVPHDCCTFRNLAEEHAFALRQFLHGTIVVHLCLHPALDQQQIVATCGLYKFKSALKSCLV
jgi:hypothetical protein